MEEVADDVDRCIKTDFYLRSSLPAGKQQQPVNPNCADASNSGPYSV